MNFTDIKIIDPILSILVSIFILINALGNLKTILEIFLIKVTKSINIDDIKNKLLEEKEVIDVHHIHVWTIDGYNNFAILHIVLNKITSNIILSKPERFNTLLYSLLYDNKTIEYAKSALERSGVREIFFEPDTFCEDQGVKPPKGYYPFSLHIREDKYYDKFDSLDNPDLRVQRC